MVFEVINQPRPLQWKKVIGEAAGSRIPQQREYYHSKILEEGCTMDQDEHIYMALWRGCFLCWEMEDWVYESLCAVFIKWSCNALSLHIEWTRTHVCNSMTTPKLIAMKVIKVFGHNLLKAFQPISIRIKCYVFTVWTRETKAKMRNGCLVDTTFCRLPTMPNFTSSDQFHMSIPAFDLHHALWYVAVHQTFISCFMRVSSSYL